MVGTSIICTICYTALTCLLTFELTLCLVPYVAIAEEKKELQHRKSITEFDPKVLKRQNTQEKIVLPSKEGKNTAMKTFDRGFIVELENKTFVPVFYRVNKI